MLQNRDGGNSQPESVTEMFSEQESGSRTHRRKAALELALFLAALFAVWTIRATWLYAVDESIGSETLRVVHANGLKLLLWVVPAAAFGYWRKGQRPARYLALSNAPGWPQWKTGLLVTVAFLLAVVAFEASAGGRLISFQHALSTNLLVGLLSFGVSPLLEEILFRGLVMKELLNLLPVTFANLLTSLLFAAIHLPYWLSHGGYTPALAANVVGVFLFSLLAGWVFAKSGSVWPPTVAHVLNNLVSALLVVRQG